MESAAAAQTRTGARPATISLDTPGAVGGPGPANVAKPAGAYRHGDLKNAVLAAARRLLSERGEPDFTMREIAALTGVRHAALYRHYAAKEILLEEIVRRDFEALIATLEAAVDAAPAGGASRALADAYLAFAESQPAAYRLFARTPTQASARESAAPNLLARAALADGDAEAGPALGRARWALLHGLALFRLSGRLSAQDLSDCLAAFGRPGG